MLRLGEPRLLPAGRALARERGGRQLLSRRRPQAAGVQDAVAGRLVELDPEDPSGPVDAEANTELGLAGVGVVLDRRTVLLVEQTARIGEARRLRDREAPLAADDLPAGRRGPEAHRALLLVPPGFGRCEGDQ